MPGGIPSSLAGYFAYAETVAFSLYHKQKLLPHSSRENCYHLREKSHVVLNILSFKTFTNFDTFV